MPRSIAFYLGLILVGLLFLYRLFQVQVINDDYAARAERNATAAEKLYAPRGYVYDRDGRLLVGNSPAYDLMVSPYLIKDLDTTALGHLLDLEVSDRLHLSRILRKIRTLNNIVSVTRIHDWEMRQATEMH